MTRSTHSHGMAGQGYVQRPSPAALALVVLLHAAALVALQSAGSLVPPVPPAALMVELLQDAVQAPKASATVPVMTPAITPAMAPSKPQPAPSSRSMPRPDVPVLAVDGARSESTVDVAKAEKPEAASNAPVAAPSGAVAAKPSSSTTASASAASALAEVQTAPRFDASYLDNPAPAYPPLSKRAGEEGRVLLHVFVEASGAAGKVELRTSSGFERLDRSAVAAVSRWKFVPAKQGGQAVAAWVLVPIVFSLKG